MRRWTIAKRPAQEIQWVVGPETPSVGVSVFEASFSDEDVERMAEAFHAAYERHAPEFDYRTREASAVPWEDVPENNRALMKVATADAISAYLEGKP